MIKSRKNIEIEGRTVEDAIRKALEELEVSRDEIEVKVLSEEKKGLFGMEGAKPAKIKVWLKTEKNS
jgi:spoIIIJ-associated protein